MLTYETLRKILAEERNTSKLTRLPQDFFDEVRTYLDKKERMSKEKDDSWEMESSRRVLNDILEIRERKILTIALYYVRSGIIPTNLENEEKELFDKTVEIVKSFQRRRREILEGKKEPLVTLAFLDDVPEFVGLDMKNYGPFRKGDIATLPENNSKVLIEQGLVSVMGPEQAS